MSDYMTCPECATNIPLPEDTVQGEIVQCPKCSKELEVISLKPFTLNLAPVEEDWWEIRVLR